MLKVILRNEWRSMIAERSLVWLALVLAATLGYGAYNGRAWVDFMAGSLAATEAEYRDRLSKLRSDFLAYEAGTKQPAGFSDPRSANAVGGTSAAPYLSMPPGPLATLAIGQSDLQPYYYKLSLRSAYLTLSNDEIENPVNLLSGHFDVAFVVVYLYPLLILALTYNLLSGEKERGTLAMTLANPVALASLVLGKVYARAMVAVAAVAAVGALGLALGGSPVRVAWWVGVMLLYGAFWFAVAILVNAFGKTSATNALILATVWLGLALLVPSLLSLVANAVYPVPSRVEMIQAMRNAGQDAQRKGSQSLARYFEDHPELAPQDGKRPDVASLTIAAQQEVDRLIQPILDRYDEQTRAQQGFVDRFCYLSPAVLAQRALTDLAGTGDAAFRHFSEQASAFLRQWQAYFFPRIYARKLFLAAELPQFPAFRYQAEPWELVRQRVGAALLGIGLPTALVLAMGLMRLRRYRIAER